MFKIFKRIASKIKCVVFRIPNEKTLSGCFADNFPTMPNPVKRLKPTKQSECFGLSAEELQDLIEDNTRQLKDISSSVDCLNKAVKEMEYKKVAKDERPKFKCKCNKDDSEGYHTLTKEKQEQVRSIIDKCKRDKDEEIKE